MMKAPAPVRLDVVGKPSRVRPDERSRPPGSAAAKSLREKMKADAAREKWKTRDQICRDIAKSFEGDQTHGYYRSGWVVSKPVPDKGDPLVVRMRPEISGDYLAMVNLSQAYRSRGITARRIGMALHQVDIGPALVCDVIAITVPSS